MEWLTILLRLLENQLKMRDKAMRREDLEVKKTSLSDSKIIGYLEKELTLSKSMKMLAYSIFRTPCYLII